MAQRTRVVTGMAQQLISLAQTHNVAVRGNLGGGDGQGRRRLLGFRGGWKQERGGVE